MRIKEIKIKNFRGFHKSHPINLHDVGKNAIIYGKNGSGKSSLFLALKQFLNAADTKIKLNNRNLFATPNDDAYIKLTLNNGNSYEWTETSIITDSSELLAGYKYSGFLEYRDILATHYLNPNETKVNLFELLIFTLLADIENPKDTTVTFKKHWERIQNSIPTDNRKQKEIKNLESDIQDFCEGLNDILEQLQTELTSIFNDFKYGKVKLTFKPVYLEYNRSTKSIISNISSQNIEDAKPEIILNIEFGDRKLEGKHPEYLNEAKLSAIGISIYLAALQLKPVSSSDLAILVLDDVLIGLDMSNRLPIIDIIEKYFIDKYQIFLMTYDLEWFEILCEYFVEPDKTNWKAFEFYCSDDDELELPIFAERSKGRDEYIKRAEKYYSEQDYKAAAVYIRSAYEAILKFFCNKYRVLIPYHDKPKSLKADEIWTYVKEWKKKDGTSYVDAQTAKAIEKATKRIFNPLSHSRPVQTYSREVKDAIDAVKNLYNLLK
ncbi:MAG: ATP-binding protein [Cyanobacteria bacterium LVE1205-1]|jgi:energy-coupling factor transporter ATP-binding protein EcfA2